MGGPVLRIGMVVDRPGRLTPPPLLLTALVDSGADRTTFPLKIARGLGIQQDELILRPGGGRGVKSRFDVWTSSLPIRAGVSTYNASTGADAAWGPAFTLRPFFIDDGSFLLGRADFFSVFTVTFEEGRGRVFHLDVEPAVS
jgi:hypothetical protein